MAPDVLSEPGVITRVELDRSTPDPADCLGPGENLIVTGSLSPGWVAVTDREFLVYHPDRDPAVVRTPRQNVTGLAVRRTGGQSLLGHAPALFVYAVVGVALGALMLSISPETLISIPDAPGAGEIEAIVRTFGWAMGLLGTVLVFSGILAALVVVTLLGYWLVSGDVAFVLERGDADPIERPTTKAVGTRALRNIESELTD